MKCLLVASLLFIFFVSNVYADSAQNSTINTTNVGLPDFIANNPLGMTAWSEFKEYLAFSLQNQKAAFQELKAKYSLGGMYDQPVLGEVLMAVWLIVNGHYGLFLGIAQNVGLLIIVGFIILKLTIEKTLRALLRWAPIYDAVEALLATFIAIGLSSIL